MNTEDDTFTIDENIMHVQYDPVNGADTFAALLDKMCDKTDTKDIYVIFDDGVATISSVYVGILLATALRLRAKGRVLHVRCTSGLRKVMKYVGGETLLEFTECWR